ncbi:uncharacterized protein LOC130996574 isoform X3 [Salvia miltiorrhiza]|nr:uncharacterized protein LOC130996574 isoform X3 [Salvia miltiorrhiza]
MMKFRRKLTEAEKEERKLRHIMANRESARQTIRRRQAMHLELTKKAADVLEENENLKKHKELMVEDFNSLRERNEFLKARLAEAQKVVAGDTKEEPDSSEAEKTCSAATATTPIFHQNQPPSLAPCFWPFAVPSSDVFPFQCVSHPHLLQLPRPPGDTPCLHSTVTPLFIVPVPWLLPLVAQSSTGGNMGAEAYNPMQNVSADSDPRAHQPPAAIVVPGLFSPVRRLENLDPPRTCQTGDIADLKTVSGHETVGDGLFRGKPEDMVVATEARRRRKELMRLKNINCK